MSVSDFIFGLLGGPMAPVIEWAAGSSKDHINASIGGAVVGTTVAATTAGTILTLGAAAPAAGATDAAVAGGEIGTVGVDAGAATDAGVGAGAAATDLGTSAATDTAVGGEVATAAAPAAETATAAAPATTGVAATDAAATPAATAPTTAVDAGTSVPTVSPEASIDETQGGETLINETTQKGATALGKARIAASAAGNAMNVQHGIQGAMTAKPPPQVAPGPELSSGSKMQALPTPTIAQSQSLTNQPTYNAVFGSPPPLQFPSPQPIQPQSSYAMSDIRSKTNVRDATESLKLFLHQVSTLYANSS